MVDTRLRRINREIADCNNDKSVDVAVELIDNSPFHLKGTLAGPKDTPYDGGTFEVDIVFPEGYPLRPPRVKFITKVYHPNISSVSGVISLNILSYDWCPALVLRIVLISLQAFLASPEPNDPLDVRVAEHYKASKQSFDETARYWTRVYARGSSQGEPPEIDEIAIAGLDKAHVDKFEWFGFDRSKIIEVLQRLNYRGENVANISEEQVVEELLE